MGKRLHKNGNEMQNEFKNKKCSVSTNLHVASFEESETVYPDIEQSSFIPQSYKLFLCHVRPILKIAWECYDIFSIAKDPQGRYWGLVNLRGAHYVRVMGRLCGIDPCFSRHMEKYRL